MKVTVIGAGLAGCEAAWQLSLRGVMVDLIEMKPKAFSPAHHNPDFAELVCSNSLKNDSLDFPTGVLKAELREMGSLLMQCADEAKVPDSASLSVDRAKFSKLVTNRIRGNPLINIQIKEATEFEKNAPTIVAAGPLCSEKLAQFIENLTGERLYFYDAVAPIVSGDSIDMSKAFYLDKHSEEQNYLNCPLTKSEYELFVNELAKAERVNLHDFEKEVNFEGCLPVEVMARRGKDVLRFGPMRASGLKFGEGEPYAVVQLRRENVAGDMFNLVGFQTNLTFSEQKRVFSLIPALHNAEWLRYGVMHRNTYINAPKYLNRFFQLKSHPNIMFAGQISGVEGYVESIASGLLCGINMVKYILGKSLVDFSTETCLGALSNYLEAGSESHFQPMHINWGLLKPIDAPKQKKKQLLAERALEKIKAIKSKI